MLSYLCYLCVCVCVTVYDMYMQFALNSASSASPHCCFRERLIVGTVVASDLPAPPTDPTHTCRLEAE